MGENFQDDVLDLVFFVGVVIRKGRAKVSREWREKLSKDPCYRVVRGLVGVDEGCHGLVLVHLHVVGGSIIDLDVVDFEQVFAKDFHTFQNSF